MKLSAARICMLTLPMLLLAACASAPTPISADTRAKIKTIGVVSLGARTFGRQYVGLTVFGNEYESEDISAWKVDADYEAQLAQVLEARFGMKVVQAGDEASKADAWGLGKTGMNWEGAAPAVKSLCNRHSLDAVLVIAPARAGDTIGGSNQILSGAGSYARIGKGGRSVMHLVAEAALVDCTAGKVLTSGRVGGPTSEKPDGFSVPMKPVWANVSRVAIANWTPDTREQVHKDLSSLPVASWEATLRTVLGPGH